MVQREAEVEIADSHSDSHTSTRPLSVNSIMKDHESSEGF